MNYSLSEVPTFLLHDGISWCLKNNKPFVVFFRTLNGIRETINGTPEMIFEELMRRLCDMRPTVICVRCGSETDGRAHFHIGAPLCTPCYWSTIKALYDGGASLTPDMNIGNMASLRPKEETPEEIAARLGVPLDVLQDTGYFD